MNYRTNISDLVWQNRTKWLIREQIEAAIIAASLALVK